MNKIVLKDLINIRFHINTIRSRNRINEYVGEWLEKYKLDCNLQF